jgi:selenocysteine-specific elongation factor
MPARKNIMLGTAGHVDHGKTALVKLLTGCDTDRLAEEKNRGLTIELGFAPCTMADEQIVGIVDVPGHVDFIRNMVAGAHGVDVVILVVAADDGVMPQTREHLDILTLMGCSRGLVALTKVDLVDAELRDLARDDIARFVAGTFLEGKAICPVSSVTGEGFDGFLSALNAEVAAAEPSQADGPFRLWVERSFSVHGFGTVATGIPTAGQVRTGQKLTLLPGRTETRVRSMEVYGHSADVARAGECAALNLADLDIDAFRAGLLLTEPDAPDPVTIFEAELTLLPSAGRDLADYTEVHLHVGTAEAMARAALLAGEPLRRGQSAPVQLRCDRPLPAGPRERFVIRGSGPTGRLTTLGGGVILSTSDRKLRRKRPWTLESLAGLARAVDSTDAWIAEHLRQADALLTPAELARRSQASSSRVERQLDQLAASGEAQQIAGRWIHTETLDSTGQAIATTLDELHSAEPQRLGFGRATLAEATSLAPELLAAAAEQWTAEGHLAAHGDLLALPGRGAALSEAEQATVSGLERKLRQANLTPPRPAELAEQVGCDGPLCEKLLTCLCDTGRAVRLDDSLVMHAEAVDQARTVALDLFRRGGGFETVAFRDALGVSRKFAVPLLDYFDTIGWTVRNGSRRTPGRASREQLNDAAGPRPAGDDHDQN